MPPWLIVFIYALLISLALCLLAIVWWSAKTRRRRKRVDNAFDVVPEVDNEVAHERLPEELSRSAGVGLSSLAEGDPRNAIVRCWLALEDTVTSAGLARDPALTSEEFTAVVIGRYAVGPGSIAELAALYREARFSTHDLGESHRRRAVHALNDLRDDLDRAGAGQGVATTGAVGGNGLP
jgi:cbb3-type cytochrome oxidase subunit 3